MKKINALLVLLISSLAITGMSFIDGKIWDIIFIVTGMIAYALVGGLFSLGIIFTKQQGKDAYAFVFFLLILGEYAVYKILEALRNWILSWPLVVRIAVPVVIGSGIIVGIVFVIRYAIKNKEKLKADEDNGDEE